MKTLCIKTDKNIFFYGSLVSGVNPPHDTIVFKKISETKIEIVGTATCFSNDYNDSDKYSFKIEIDKNVDEEKRSSWLIKVLLKEIGTNRIVLDIDNYSEKKGDDEEDENKLKVHINGDPMPDTIFAIGLISGMTTDEFKIVRAIIEYWKDNDKMPSTKQVKMELDRQKRRWCLTDIEKVYENLELRKFVTVPGPHTGLRQSTELGRDFFRIFLGNFTRDRF